MTTKAVAAATALLIAVLPAAPNDLSRQKSSYDLTALQLSSTPFSYGKVGGSSVQFAHGSTSLSSLLQQACICLPTQVGSTPSSQAAPQCCTSEARQPAEQSAVCSVAVEGTSQIASQLTSVAFCRGGCVICDLRYIYG